MDKIWMYDKEKFYSADDSDNEGTFRCKVCDSTEICYSFHTVEYCMACEARQFYAKDPACKMRNREEAVKLLEDAIDSLTRVEEDVLFELGVRANFLYAFEPEQDYDEIADELYGIRADVMRTVNYLESFLGKLSGTPRRPQFTIHPDAPSKIAQGCQSE